MAQGPFNFRDAARRRGLNIDDLVQEVSLPAAPTGQEPADLEIGALWYDSTTNKARLRTPTGDVDVGSGGSAGGTSAALPRTDPAAIPTPPAGTENVFLDTRGVARRKTSTGATPRLVETGEFDVREFNGTGSDTIFNNTVRLQQAIDYARANSMTALLPVGVIDLTDTLKIGYGDVLTPGVPDLQKICRVVGAGAGGHPFGTVLVSHLVDRPALNVQVCPWLRLEGFNVAGQNVNTVAHQQSPNPPRNLSDYFRGDLGIQTRRYNPYAGITINAYGGPPPPTPYPNDPYNRGNGGGGVFREIAIHGFEAGIVINPAGNGAGLGNSYTFEKLYIDLCAYGISLTDSNGRNISIKDCVIGGAWAALTNCVHGGQGGFLPTVFGGEWNSCFRLFDLNSATNSMTIIGLSGEIIHQIGRWAGAGRGLGLNLEACTFYQGVDGMDGHKEAVQLIASGPVSAKACTFAIPGDTLGSGAGRNPGIFNVVGAPQMRWEGCVFTHSPTNDWVVDRGYVHPAGHPQLENCDFSSSALPEGVTLFRENYSAPLDALSAGNRLKIHRVGGGTVTATHSFLPTERYILEPPDDGYTFVDTSVIAWDNTLKQITFNLAVLGEIRVGDWLLAQLKSTSPSLAGVGGAIYGQGQIPLFTVAEVTGSLVRAVPIWDNYDEIVQHASGANVVTHHWAVRGFTGNLVAGNSVVTTNFNPQNVVRVGDFIRADAGLEPRTRVTAVSSTQITLAKASNNSRTNEPLYFVKAIRQPEETFSAAPPIPTTAVEYWHSLMGASGTTWTGQIGGRVLTAPGSTSISPDSSFFKGRAVAQANTGSGWRGVGFSPVFTTGNRAYSFSVFRMRVLQTAANEWGIFDLGADAALDAHYIKHRVDANNFRLDYTGGPSVVIKSPPDLIPHILEVWPDGTNLITQLDGGTPVTGAFTGGLFGNITAIAIGMAASGVYHMSDSSHAFHMICSSVPTPAERAALRAWARGYWGV